jgi:hypothetical protein
MAFSCLLGFPKGARSILFSLHAQKSVARDVGLKHGKNRRVINAFSKSFLVELARARLKYASNQEKYGEARVMIGLNANMRSTLFTSLSILLMFAMCVLPSFGERRIYISGITPSSVYPHGAVRVYGGGATPKGAVVAMLGGPVIETFIAGNGTSPWVDVGASNLTLGSTFAGDSGDWEINFLTPDVFPGYHNVYVFDNESLTTDVIGFNVLINVTVVPIEISNMTGITIWTSNMTGPPPPGPLLFFVSGTVMPSFGAQGTLVTMLGRFASGGEISVYFDNLLVATVNGQSRNWSSSFHVPDVLVGNHTIRAIDVEGRWMSSVSFYVTSPFVSFSLLSLSLLGLYAVVVFLGATLCILLAALDGKRKKQK